MFLVNLKGYGARSASAPEAGSGSNNRRRGERLDPTSPALCPKRKNRVKQKLHAGGHRGPTCQPFAPCPLWPLPLPGAPRVAETSSRLDSEPDVSQTSGTERQRSFAIRARLLKCFMA